MNPLIQPASKLDSIAAYNTYGVSPSHLRFMVQNIFYFPTMYKDTLTSYHLDVIDTPHFLSCIEEGMLDFQGTYHQIIYHNTDPTRLLRRAAHTRVKLSYREVDTVFGIPPTVLVKEMK